MGANSFTEVGYGKSVAEAFDAAAEQARWEHGHGGYSGTLAEKRDFVMLQAPAGMSAHEFAAAAQDYWLLDRLEDYPAAAPRLDPWRHDLDKVSAIKDAYERTDDKRGPAGALELAGAELEQARKNYQSKRGASYQTDPSGREIPGSRVWSGVEPDELRFFIFFGKAPS